MIPFLEFGETGFLIEDAMNLNILELDSIKDRKESEKL